MYFLHRLSSFTWNSSQVKFGNVLTVAQSCCQKQCRRVFLGHFSSSWNLREQPDIKGYNEDIVLFLKPTPILYNQSETVGWVSKWADAPVKITHARQGYCIVSRNTNCLSLRKKASATIFIPISPVVAAKPAASAKDDLSIEVDRNLVF